MLFLTSCSAHRVVVQQGNALETPFVSQVSAGMSKQQVIDLLGSPMMQDDFRANRWDYVFYRVDQGKRSPQKNLVLYFADDKVVKIN